MSPQAEAQGGAVQFIKMHGAENDFVLLDRRSGGPEVTPGLARTLGDRRSGVGFDQLIVLRPAQDADAAVRLDFLNADGSAAAACGNGTRCAAHLIFEETRRDRITIETASGRLDCQRAGAAIRVNMGPPRLTWDGVPLAYPVDIDALPLDGTPAAVGMGNPHCVFFVDDAEAVDLAKEGPLWETHPLFPERTNVEFVHIIDRGHIRMRVWERGGMITRACGSGACAVAVAAARRGLTGREVTIRADGGPLELHWADEGVWLSGPTARVFEGVLDREVWGQ
ncbi:MAG: diaminopimelate epimerase [Pseudomonadota bacterium]